MKYLILVFVAAIILFPKQTANQNITSFEQFCDVYMQWVKRYPLALNPGECA
jgi:hypothetical protein